MKRILVAGFCLIGFAGLAQAADMAVKAPVRPAPIPAPVASWTGFYIGLGLGTRTFVADGHVGASTNNGAPLLNGSGCTTPDPSCPGSSITDTAFRVSGYFGYNWQFAPQWLFGVEGDVGWADHTRSVNGELLPGGGNPFFVTGRADDSFGIRTRWDASIRGRLGWLATPNFLLYATGGGTWLQFDAISTCGTSASCAPGAFGPNVIVDGRTRFGWTVGGGLETMFWSNWIARLEYRFADFGTVTNTDVRVCPGVCGLGTITQVETSSIKLQTHTVTVGIAYKFGDYGTPAVAARY